MSLFSNSTVTSTTITSTFSTVRAVSSATGTFTHDPIPTWTYPDTRSGAYAIQVVDIPSTCKAIREFKHANYTDWPWGDTGFVELSANPDIAGLGIILSFIATAYLVLLLAIIAYFGGFLPGEYLRRADRLVVHANSRNENSRWREIFQSVTLSLSDQQLVTGLAILVAGYYEMVNNDLSVYHWNIVVNLAWMSSAVHIASLTLLRDVLNKGPTLRNIRVAGMILLLLLLTVAMWPLRRLGVPWGTPVKCLWRSQLWNSDLDHVLIAFDPGLDPDRVISVIMLLGAYIWKMSQLFSTSRGWARRWLVAEPQAAVERLMRRALFSHRPTWQVRPAYLLLAHSYIVTVVYAEMAESFVAAIMYLCLALPWGTFCISYYRIRVSEKVKDGEATLSFGQLVPLFLLVLPALAGLNIYGLSAEDVNASREKPGRIYSLLVKEVRASNAPDTDLSTVLRSNNPSQAEDKLQNDSIDSFDPVIDHLMGSKAFRIVNWISILCVLLLGIFWTVGGTAIVGDGPVRYLALGVGIPMIFGFTVGAAAVAMACSRRLR